MWRCAFTCAFSLCSAANYVVSGVVVDSQSHKPLANAHVSLAPSAARAQKLELITKQDGRFSFAMSQAGKYALPRWPSRDIRRKTIGQIRFCGMSSAIVVRDDQDTSHIVFEASRGAAITGLIKDEDSEPVGNALVSIFQSSIVGGERKIRLRGQMRANAAGEFRLSSLPRGNYYICAMGRPWFADSLLQLQQIQEFSRRTATQPLQDGEPAQIVPQYSPDPSFRGSAFATTFYPRAPTIEEASLVRLDAGGETQISIALPLAKAVTVKGIVNLPADSVGRANLLKKAYDQYVLFLQEVVAKDGTFQFKNVPPGSYEIVATSESSSGASSWNVRQEVAIGTSDMDVTLRPQSLGSVSGHVRFEGERPASTATLRVSLRNDEGNQRRVEVDSAGNFSFDRLPAGRYEVTAASADYVAAYFAGPSGERLPLTVEITSGEPVRRDLTLTKAVSVIEGTVEKTEAPQVGAFVLLMPKNPSQRWAYRVDQTDSDGSYRLATIPAGDYFLIALSDGAEVAYRDPKVAAILTKAAKPVHIEPGDHLDMKVDIWETAALNLPSL